MVRGVAARQFWSNRLLMMAMKTSTGRQMCLSLDFVATCCWRGKCLQQEEASEVGDKISTLRSMSSSLLGSGWRGVWTGGLGLSPSKDLLSRLNCRFTLSSPFLVSVRFPKSRRSDGERSCNTPVLVPVQSAPDDGDEDIDRKAKRFPKGRRSDGERSCNTPVPVPVQSPPDDGDEDIDRKAKMFIVGFRHHLLLER
ncbi:hypothetical protein QYF36_023527 [Acer negundo]|nr:hypothetical protein QYF36_023527 [Acer negundo]